MGAAIAKDASNLQKTFQPLNSKLTQRNDSIYYKFIFITFV